ADLGKQESRFCGQSGWLTQDHNQGRVDISCRKYVSEFLYRHGDPVPLVRQILHSETDAQVTESPAFSIRHLVWSFSCSHPAADAIESSSHSAPAPAPGLFWRTRSASHFEGDTNMYKWKLALAVL